MSAKFSKFFLVLTIILTIVAYAVCSVMHANTIVNGWIVMAICFALSLLSRVTMWRLWRTVTGSQKIWVNYIMQVAVATAVFMLLFYIPNSVFADNQTKHEEKAVAERVYYQTRHKSRRISRRVYGRGEAYKVYFVDVKFKNGARKSLEIPLKQYNRIRKGDSLRYELEKGLFGVTVIRRRGNYSTVPSSSYRHNNPLTRERRREV